MRKIVSGLFIALDGVVEALKRMKLVSTKVTRTGTVILTYQSVKE